jgi:nitrite reductase/ring-hydroxylating ferredoxin subunit
MQQNPIKRFARFALRKACLAVGMGEAASSEDAVRVASVKDIKEGKSWCADVHGKEVAIFKLHGNYFALDNTCPHMGGPLCKGGIKDGVITCPWHGSQFEIETGALMRGPAKSDAHSYAVEVRGNDIYIKARGEELAKEAKPVSVKMTFQSKFDAAHPFAHEAFVNDVLEGMKFPMKLYGVRPHAVISHSPDEMDLHLGEVHVTEMDLKKMSEVMDRVNAKWGTEITYCLFHTTQFPRDTLLNIRGQNAPNNVSSEIKF